MEGTVIKSMSTANLLGNALFWICIPFVLTTLFFGFYKGETVYYDSDDYDGNGTAH